MLLRRRARKVSGRDCNMYSRVYVIIFFCSAKPKKSAPKVDANQMTLTGYARQRQGKQTSGHLC